MTVKEIRIGWAAGTARLSRWIRVMDYARDKLGKRIPSRINHVLIHFIFQDGPDIIIEALFDRGIQTSPFRHLELALREQRVTRLIEYVVPLPPAALAGIWTAAERYHGKGYDKRLLVLYLIWGRYFGKSKIWDFIFRLDNPDRFTCNEFAVGVLAGRIPEIPATAPKDFTPEGLFKAVMGMSSPDYVAKFLDPIAKARHAIQIGKPEHVPPTIA